MNNEQLYKDLKSYFASYIDTIVTEICILVLYTIGTHYFQNYQTYPVLHITGDYGTGKNRRLDILEIFCFKPVVLTSPSLASVIRLVHTDRGTVLIDEADNLLKSAEMETMLLSGYKYGGQSSRAIKASSDSDYKAKMYDVYSPKVLVTRLGLTSDALKSRSITIITLPKSKDSSIPSIFRHKDRDIGLKLRKMLEDFLRENKQLKSYDLALDLSNRDKEILDCLEDVAGAFGQEAIDDLTDFVKSIYLPETKFIVMSTLNEALITTLCEIWNKQKVIYVKDIRKIISRKYSDFKYITEKEIAAALRSLNFEIKRRSSGNYVVRDSRILKTWSDRYVAKYDDSESPSSNVEDVADAAKSDEHRPKRITTDAIKKQVSKNPRKMR